MKQSMQLLTSSETADWYTPPHIIDAARETMGWIDLDPASCEAANRWIQADRIFTIEDDGLAQPWGGKCWLNPPYGKTGSRSNQDIWARKLEAEFEAGRVTEACMLTKAVPGYAWWERLFRRWPVCFVEHRISFLRLDETGEIVDEGQAKAGASIWYIGPRLYWSIFAANFCHLGRIIRPVLAEGVSR